MAAREGRPYREDRAAGALTLNATIDQTADLAEFIAHFQHRVLQDALTEATSSYWRRRAEIFAAVGNAACDVIALACRNRAAVSYFQDDSDHPCCRRLEAS